MAAPLPDIATLTAEQIAALKPEQIAAAAPAQIAAILKRQDELRWAGELPYFRGLHELLPEPFFQTSGFLGFLFAVGLVYWLMPRKWIQARVWLLVVASFHFYAAWNASLAFLVTGTATLDYVLARLIQAAPGRGQKRMLVGASVSMNLAILGYFKYRGFFLNELHALVGRLGTDPGFTTLSPLDILIPFGISFYTFEAISYAVDVYRGKVEAERRLSNFLLFILFFPHLVAGPIVRAGDFLRQTRRVHRWDWVRVEVGVQFFLMGVFKKFAVADRMAQFCDPILADPEKYNGSALWLATLAYALRIYADFSGYSDMAVGTAHLFGYRLTQNFAMPYLSANVSEFWRRWHISLSTWIRDYIFIPLGGSRGSSLATDRNLLVAMLLGGLWHGASWGYVVWGGLHGLMLVGHRHFARFAEARPGLKARLDSNIGTVLRTALTFLAVSVCWVFFQPDLHKALIMLERMFTAFATGAPLPLPNRSLWYTALFILACHLLVAKGVWERVWPRLPPIVVGAAYALVLNEAMVLAPEQNQAFIYFTF